MNSQTFRIENTALASRQSAAALRALLENALETGSSVIDFSKVESVSESYADELLGVLVASRSLPWVFERLELRGVRPAVSHTLISAIRRRLSSTVANSFDDAVSTAREALVRHRTGVAA